MRRVTRLGSGIALLLAITSGWRIGSVQASQGLPIRPGFVVYEADAEQVQMARWAANRFEASELGVPQVEVHFHKDLSSCRGNLGYALGGRVDLCRDTVDVPARRALLHEMSHIWMDENLTPSSRMRFLELRDLSGWNASYDPWGLRGYEQGAEVIAWALGERILMPSIPDNEPEQLEIAYGLITGREAPEPP